MGLMPPTPASDSSKRLISDPSESREPSKLAKLSEDTAGVKGAGEEAPEEALEPETPGMSQNPRVQRYLVAVEYIGTGFFGSQKQPNCRTVTGSVESSDLRALADDPFIFLFAGQTLELQALLLFDAASKFEGSRQMGEGGYLLYMYYLGNSSEGEICYYMV
ncbi:hypothetical protein KSP40_PGU002220 [Platanthera guangdongensis]|uniref:Uncharacterized protein n=1 Tax=Platanthera guangdongensis TaxID=2320717 RepID=A0ABR2N1L2_9ASPA